MCWLILSKEEESKKGNSSSPPLQTRTTSAPLVIYLKTPKQIDNLEVSVANLTVNVLASQAMRSGRERRSSDEE